MERGIYDEDHEAFRDVVKEFVKRYATEEKRKQWEADGEIDRATMLAAGEAGIIGLSVPEEFGGAGMLHPNVLKAAGIDPDEYSGLAFGWGIERTYMMKEGLNLDDIRTLYKNDIRFLEQF